MNKISLRKHYADLRSGIPLAYRQQAAQAAAHLLKTAPIFLQSERIACYSPVKAEFDANPIIEAIWAAKKYCYLPILAAKEEKFLAFAEYHYGDPLHFNRYHILEPVNHSRDISPRQLNLVITPLLAFDDQGARLGTGGGYYDRTFAFLNEEKINQPIMMGLGFAEQEATNLPTTAFDVVLQYVLTEKKLITCSGLGVTDRHDNF